MAFEDKLVGPALKVKNYLDKFPNIYNAYFIVAISCISGMMFGFDISSMSAIISTDLYKDYFGRSMSSDMQGFITSSMALGSFFGSICSTFVSEPFGRRISLWLCACLWCIGAAIQSSSQNRAQLIIGRIISGWGVGFGSTVAPVYSSELAPRRIRGILGGLFQFMVTLGILIMYFISYGCHFIDGVASFRLAWGLQIVPGILLFFGCLIIPESPRWLAKNGYWEDAEFIVAQIQAKGDRQDPDVLIEISEIKEQIMLDEHIKAFTYADLFKKKYLLRTFTAVWAQIWQQMTGMNVMMYYITYIFLMAGYSGDSNLVASSIQYVINTVVTIPGFLLLDKVGRREMLIVGGIAMMTWQFGLAGILATYSVPYPDSGNPSVTIRIPEDDKPAAKGAIACCYLFVASFAMTWGVGIWGYCAEIWGDNAARQRGAAVSTAANWIMNFAIAMYSPASFQNIDWKTYMIYGSCCFVMAVHCFFGFPETKGKRLEEIAQIWEEGVPAWKTNHWKPRIPLLSDSELANKLDVSHAENGNKELLESNSHSDEEKETGK